MPRLPAFDVLVDMARNDPQGLETLRRSLTDAVITAASNEATRRRLQGLQFLVDVERRRATTPLAATIRISEMMCRSLAELRRCMIESVHGEPSQAARAAPQEASAEVVPLFPRASA
ncbi:MAG: DUF3135 domain-containing protein [Pseudomonadales bacterium]